MFGPHAGHLACLRPPCAETSEVQSRHELSGGFKLLTKGEATKSSKDSTRHGGVRSMMTG